MTDLPILDVRRIEANIIKPIYEEMVEQLGKEQAQNILGAAIEKAAIDQGKSLADGEKDGPSLRAFISLFERWKMGGALEVDVLNESDDQFDFNITRCRYAEMYQDMEMAKLDICYRVAEMGLSVLDMTPGLNWNGGKRLWVGLATAILDINLKLRIKAILKDLF